MKRKQKIPVTTIKTIQNSPTSSVLNRKNSKHTANLIRLFHTLNKRHAYHVSQNQPTHAEEVKRQLAELGGLEAYQRASELGQSSHRGGDTSKRIVDWLCSLGLNPIQKQKLRLETNDKDKKYRLLDVGALLRNNYKSCEKWIQVVAIDLNPREKGILKRNFLKMNPPSFNALDSSTNGNTEEWPKTGFDIVCLSLVINFVGDPIKRGAMLHRTIEFLNPEGLQIMESFKYEMLRHHFSRKLAYYLFRLNPDIKISRVSFEKKILHNGKGKNNFCIVVK
ncbi:hypothetical protein G9A89_014834 [Geosiphon pyriformis]|nr:hypothetical protein G9A89_014834 [Geosiphon pyriformis]